jgi:hypothetical protein
MPLTSAPSAAPVGITSIEPAALRPDVIATLSVIGASRM